ncbi:histidinol-phosphate transaminase [Gordonia humi]|uniref:Aromatic amino acid aminotransferase n=1 Tax=Gordonia humi TaxID=686429 RepID=A0A840F1L1_9ACTN|nr:histidinol-phosphate aminotransferase [Gordonia humi]
MPNARPILRATLDAVPAYVPGSTAPAGWKLSSNELAHPPLDGVLDAVSTAATQMNRYPDLAAVEVRSSLADRLDVPVRHIAVGAGSSELLQQVMRIAVDPGDEVVYAWRSFESYPIVTGLAGARAVEVPLNEDESHDLPAMADAVSDRTRAVVVCTPNNPTGRALRSSELSDFLARIPSTVLIVLDEAYTEFATGPDRVDGARIYRDHPNLVVLRTFSKAYGLAGLRIGYAIAHESVAEALRKAAVPFGVSSVAQAAAVASLERHDRLIRRVAAVVAERTRVRDTLRSQGWTVPDSAANFVWLRLTDRTSDFTEHCRRVGITVRPYEPDGVRITIGEPAANDALLRAAGTYSYRNRGGRRQ